MDFNSTESTTFSVQEETNDGNRLGTVLGVTIPMTVCIIVVAAVLVYKLWYRRRTPKKKAQKTCNRPDNVHSSTSNQVSNPDLSFPDNPVYVNVEFTKPCLYQELQQKQQDNKDSVTPGFYQELQRQQNDHVDRQLVSTENAGPTSSPPVIADDIYVNESAQGTGEFELMYEYEGNDPAREQEVGEHEEQTTYENQDGAGTQEDPGMYENEDRSRPNTSMPTGNNQLGVFDLSYEDVDSPLPGQLLNQNEPSEYEPEAPSIYENVN